MGYPADVRCLTLRGAVNPTHDDGTVMNGAPGRFLRQAQDRLFDFGSRDEATRASAQDDGSQVFRDLDFGYMSIRPSVLSLK